MRLTFLGASQQVTGSMYLLELDSGYKILIDCGVNMERIDRTKPVFRPFSYFEPREVNIVLLTHAHIDHSGNIPNLYGMGYEGQVVCTTATYQLTRLLLHDSAVLNEKRRKRIQDFKSKEPRKGAKLSTEGLYGVKLAEESTEHFFNIAFNEPFRLNKNVTVIYFPTGHLLGASNILLSIEEGGQTKKLLFSGDVGRKNYPLLPGPQQLPQVDYMLCETTYACREHKAELLPETILEDVIIRTCVDKPGRLIIPAFSAGRTQTVLFLLNKLSIEGRLPDIKVFVDSPLAIESTKAYQMFPKLLNDEARQFLKKNDELFDFDNLIYLKDAKQSRQLDNYHEPCIILSAAGMMEGGRIQHHIRTNIGNVYCTIFIVGYNAEGTLGRQLMDKQKVVSIKGHDYTVACNIEVTDAFSGHASHSELIDFVCQQDPTKLKKLFLVHGEPENMQGFKSELETIGYSGVEIPFLGQAFEL
jgi:metallo-beta-lactamase family protein